MRNTLTLVSCALLLSNSAAADLIFVNAGNTLSGFSNPLDDGSNGGTVADGIADSGLTMLSHSETFTLSGVTFDLSFDLASTGGFLAGNNSSLGVWSDTTAESGGGETFSFNGAGEAISLSNVSLSNIIGGTATFNTINRVGIVFATGGSDSGTFDVGGAMFAWDELDDGDANDFTGNNIDGDTGSEGFDLRAANGSDFSSFTLTGSGGAWRLDTFEFDVTTSVPEPSSIVLLWVAVLGMMRRRRSGTIS